ncbi:MAG TPA: TraB/GumN family protein [Gammaproteobacteria bacterium]
MLRKSLLLGILLAAPVSADPLLYRMDDADSTVWLLGSVHALRASDYPLDERIENAYAESARVVLEVNPAELQPAHLGSLMISLGRRENGRTLASAFTDAEYRRLQEGLAPLGIDASLMQDYEPWFVALQVFGLNLVRNGFASAEGVDTHYAVRAAADNKRTAGLEQARDQFLLFDQLAPEIQKRFLLDAVSDSGDFRAEMEKLVATWRSGDADALEALIEEEFGDEPALRESLLDARNRRWLEPVAAYLDQPGSTLVIVGALHLVGDEGLARLLEQKGYKLEKVKK